MRRTTGRVLGVVTACAALVLAAAPASAHEERASEFPVQDDALQPPVARAYDPAATDRTLVVCKDDSDERIAALPAGGVKDFNLELLARCGYGHIQQAVDAVTVRGSNIYVLPGVYREEPSWNAPCTKDYDGGVVDYPLIVSCGEVINLVTVAGDATEDTRQVDCNQLCDLQIEGTGPRMEDVVLRGGFTEDGDWVKHNGIKADRADGFVVRNMTMELFRENALYVHETDRYLIDRVNARHNDLYGILTFTSDHGVISNCDTSYNGDSGVYPGSAADVNQQTNPPTGPLTRWAVEIFGCNTHHNALGFSGTAGNSVYFHDNLVHHNQAGYVTDSFVGGHPGMPQDHAWLTGNRIYANNNNYVKEFVQGPDAPCQREKPADRGHGQGTVCPAFPVPVGTGVLIAGGNRNLVDDNEIYDNWRAGAKLFWVPGAVRGDTGPVAQIDTSNGNHFTGNALGFHPSGVTQPNGKDFEWDEQGVGNCWQDNVSSTGEVTSDYVLPTGLPSCDSGGSMSSAGNLAKTAQMAPCATYNREDEPDPAGCDWFVTPAEPAGRQPAADDEPVVGRDDDDADRDTDTDGGTGAGTDAGTGTGTAAGTGGAAGLPAATPAPAARSLPATGSALVPAVAGLVLAAVMLSLRRRARGHP